MNLKKLLRQVQHFWKYLIVVFILLGLRFSYSLYAIRSFILEHGGEVKPYYHVFYMLISSLIAYLIKTNVHRIIKPYVKRRVN